MKNPRFFIFFLSVFFIFSCSQEYETQFEAQPEAVVQSCIEDLVEFIPYAQQNLVNPYGNPACWNYENDNAEVLLYFSGNVAVIVRNECNGEILIDCFAEGWNNVCVPRKSFIYFRSDCPFYLIDENGCFIYVHEQTGGLCLVPETQYFAFIQESCFSTCDWRNFNQEENI